MKSKYNEWGYSWVKEDVLYKKNIYAGSLYVPVTIQEIYNMQKNKTINTIVLYRRSIGQGCSHTLPIEYEPLTLEKVLEWLKEVEDEKKDRD